jgi:hypothetical protein
MRELTRCLHYTDDWDEEEDVEWETLYTDPKVEAQDGTAQHRKKFSMVEDALNVEIILTVISNASYYRSK